MEIELISSPLNCSLCDKHLPYHSPTRITLGRERGDEKNEGEEEEEWGG